MSGLVYLDGRASERDVCVRAKKRYNLSEPGVHYPSKMELVSITDEKSNIQILNRENSMRALVAWLDKYNSELAGKIWCRQTGLVRRRLKCSFECWHGSWLVPL